MTVATSASTTLAMIAGNPSTYDANGYKTLFDGSEVTVGEITDLGEFGREYNLVMHNPVDNRSTQKFKGSFNEGSMNLQLGLDTDNAGQILMKTALLSDSPYSFRVVTQNGDKYFFQAVVMSFKLGVGGVDNITSATCTLELTTSSGGVGVVEDLDT